MIIIDKALEKLEKKGKPIRVGLVGCGFAGRGFALQLLTNSVGMRLVAISNRTLKTAKKTYQDLGAKNIKNPKNQKAFDLAIKKGDSPITTNPKLLTSSKYIDVIVEATGEVEFGAQVALETIKNKKHLVLINAELDGTLGSILKKYADKEGVIYTQAEGDQPAVLMRLVRYVKQLGFKPVMVGNIKSLIDKRRTPKTQAAFARAHYQKPKMITSFADGTKIAFEMATIANATGFPVAERGMVGPKASHVDEAVNLFDKDRMLKTGITDYILGAQPSFGVFVIGYSNNPLKRRYMKVYKMGEGPFYTFYTHTHLSPLEAPISVAQAAIFNDASLSPKNSPVCDVVTLAKKDLKKGERLDGIGGFTVYGEIDNYETSLEGNLLPIGLSEGCVLKNDIKMDEQISFNDVELPKGRISDKLREEQNQTFFKNFSINRPTLTVGITTCFGDNTILDTVKSIRASKGIEKFRFIIVSDRVPINPWLKSQLKKYDVELVENKVEAGQVTKQRQILALTKSDLLILTQDDVLLDENSLKKVVDSFEQNPKTTMISILNKPVKATNFFEDVLNVGTNIANRIAKKWNRGDNYLSVIGRFMAFRTSFLKKQNFDNEKVATSDAYYYFSNKLSHGIYEYLKEVAVYFKNPQNMKEHLRKSSRFQFSKLEMSNYFKNLDLEKEYKLPKKVIFDVLGEEFLSNPFKFILYMIVFLYTRILKLKPNYVLDAIWEVDLSTKKVVG